jgi:glutathione S-transferase
MYKVIGAPRTRAFRVIWMLEELGLSYSVDPQPPRSQALAQINPSGKVPVLQDGEDYVIDSVAICQYLADKHGRLTFPAGTIARAHQDSWTQFAVDDIESCLWTCAKHTFVLPAELRTEAVKPACRHDFDRAMGVMSKRLGGKTWVMGETFTVPDLLLGNLGAWAQSMHWAIPDGDVADYMARVNARPAAVKAAEVRKAA